MRANELERRVHSQCVFHDKLHSLDLSFDPRLPERFQIALDSHYGVLYNPYVACEAAEAFLPYGTPESRAYVQAVVLQASILHPDKLDIARAFEHHFERDYVVSHPRPYAYCVARLLAWGIMGKRAKADEEFEELLFLFSNVRPVDLEIYYAICDRDYERLEGVRDAVMLESDSLYYKEWWKKFFYVYLELKVLDDDLLPAEPSSDVFRAKHDDAFFSL